MLGLVARAEVVRLLFTMQDSSAIAAQLARSAGYTKRNVHEALSPLEQAGVITAVMAGNERRYWLDQQRWSAFLDTRGPSENVEWVPILLSMRRVLRWSRASRAADLADYLVASGARDLLDRIRPGLADAGIDVPSSRRSDASVEDLFSVVNRMFEVLDIA